MASGGLQGWRNGQIAAAGCWQRRQLRARPALPPALAAARISGL
jgi:hypothetical protein